MYGERSANSTVNSFLLLDWFQPLGHPQQRTTWEGVIIPSRAMTCYCIIIISISLQLVLKEPTKHLQVEPIVICGIMKVPIFELYILKFYPVLSENTEFIRNKILKLYIYVIKYRFYVGLSVFFFVKDKNIQRQKSQSLL